MRVLIAADLHLSSYKSPYFNVLNQIKLGLYDIINYVNKNKDIKHIIIAGDVFNDKSFMYKNAIDTLDEFINALPHIDIVLITGNHDISRYGNLLDQFVHYSNVTVITDHYALENMLLVAYSPNMFEQLQNALSDYPECNVLISHFGVSEAKLQSGISIVSNVKAKQLKYFKRVILGHYHLQQTLENITYVGNLAPLNWNDKNQQKGYVVYDTESDKLEFIYPNCYVNFYEFINPDESEYDRINDLTRQGHIVRVLSSKPLPNSVVATTKVHLKQVEAKYKNKSSVLEVAKEYIATHPDKDKLLVTLNRIHQRVTKGAEL